MSHYRLKWIMVTVIAVLFAAFAGWINYYATLSDSGNSYEMMVLGKDSFAPGSEAAMRVIVRSPKDGVPVENANIKVRLAGEPAPLLEAVTDETGSAELHFTLPDTEGTETLIFETKSEFDSAIVTQTVRLEHKYRILLTTDKPTYQPGQTIFLRTLVLNAFDRSAVQQQPIELVVEDENGDEIFRDSLVTSEFGVSSADFQLATEAYIGSLKISAVMGDISTEKTVVVEEYNAPKFDIVVDTERNDYQLGETVVGTVGAYDLAGEPVADSTIVLEGFTFDTERQDAIKLEGTTNAQGYYDFQFELPSAFVGSDSGQRLDRFYVQASVTDQSQHTEITHASFPVSDQPIVIQVIPEGGVFRPNTENIVYVLTSYPDGTPVATDVTMNFRTINQGEPITTETNKFGLAEVRFTPINRSQSFDIEATDAQGSTAIVGFNYEDQNWSESSINLRTDQPIYRVGDTMQLSVGTAEPNETIYLDIVRAGQTVRTRSQKSSEGVAQIAVELTPDLFGTLEIHAYLIDSQGTPIGDTRLVVVDDAAGLEVGFSADKDTYRPGETANLTLDVSDQSGGQAAAVGLAIVGEPDFAPAEYDPSFAKLYFQLEAELLQHTHQLTGLHVPDLTDPLTADHPEIRIAELGAAHARLADSSRGMAAFSLSEKSGGVNELNNLERQENFFRNISLAANWILVIVGPTMLIVSLYFGYKNEESLTLSLMAAFGLWVLSFMVIALTGWLALSLWPATMSIIYTTLSLCGVAAAATFLYTFYNGNMAMLWMVGQLFLILPSAFVLVYAQGYTWSYLYDRPNGLLFLPILCVPLALLVRSAELYLEGKRGISIMILTATMPLSAFIPFSIDEFGASSLATSPSEPDIVLDLEVDDSAAVEEQGVQGVIDVSNGANGSSDPRLNLFFPDTLYWLPDGETGADGTFNLEVPTGDDSGTWQITALASTPEGKIGSVTGVLRVQDFFIDLNLPHALTQGDEVSIPVSVANYLPEAQSVTLIVEESAGFELLDAPEKQIDIAANDIAVAHFRIRTTAFGTFPFKVTVNGSAETDTIQKSVRVFPAGKQLTFSESVIVSSDNPTRTLISLPPDLINGSQNLTVKIMPGPVSQVVEGLDSVLELAYGDFDSVNRAAYINALVIDYLEKTDQLAPDVQLKGEEYISESYQKFKDYEIDNSGAFHGAGESNPNLMLTAFGLHGLNEISRVHAVDPASINRIADWLIDQQNSDGSWSSSGRSFSSLTEVFRNAPVTAYVVWGLVDAQIDDPAAVERGLQFLTQQYSAVDDAFELALIANAFIAYDLAQGEGISNHTTDALDNLAMLVTISGDFHEIDTTSLATLAFVRSGYHADVAQTGLDILMNHEQLFSGILWDDEDGFIFSLKSFIENDRRTSTIIDATTTVTLNNDQQRTATITPETYDLVQYVTFDNVAAGDNVIDVQVEGKGQVIIQISGDYYLP